MGLCLVCLVVWFLLYIRGSLLRIMCVFMRMLEANLLEFSQSIYHLIKNKNSLTYIHKTIAELDMHHFTMLSR